MRLVSREALKSLQLIASKVEDMVLNTPDVKKFNQGNSFSKNHAQEHNSQLIVLLSQLKDAILKLPDQMVSTVVSESNSSGMSSSLLSSSSSIYLTDNSSIAPSSSSYGTMDSLSTPFSSHTIPQGVVSQQQLSRELSSILGSAVTTMDELSVKQLYAPLLDNIMAYVKSVLIHLPTKDNSPMSPPPDTGHIVECSKSVQLLQKQLPELLQSHLQHLPKSSLLSMVSEELCLRVMHMYMTVAALTRPVTEYSRLRTSQDLSAIEDILVNVASINDSGSNRVVQEFK